MTEQPGMVREAFHTLWYDSECWKQTTWFGVPIQKNPFDPLQYQEVLVEQPPDFVIECGALHGGATLYFANLLDLIGHGRVIFIDIYDNWHDAARRYPRVQTVVGDSTSVEILDILERLVPVSSTALVLLDSDRTEAHVLRQLRAFQRFVQVGNYLVVEDTNINGHPVLGTVGPEPYEAVAEFLQETKDFVVDSSREEKLHFTFAPSGWLRRVSREGNDEYPRELVVRSRSMATRGWRALESYRRVRAAIRGLYRTQRRGK